MHGGSADRRVNRVVIRAGHRTPGRSRNRVKLRRVQRERTQITWWRRRAQFPRFVPRGLNRDQREALHRNIGGREGKLSRAVFGTQVQAGRCKGRIDVGHQVIQAGSTAVRGHGHASDRRGIVHDHSELKLPLQIRIERTRRAGHRQILPGELVAPVRVQHRLRDIHLRTDRVGKKCSEIAEVAQRDVLDERRLHAEQARIRIAQG
jgi:hypothetical protein